MGGIGLRFIGDRARAVSAVRSECGVSAESGDEWIQVWTCSSPLESEVSPLGEMEEVQDGREGRGERTRGGEMGQGSRG